ncbi:MAG: AMP-dependent synthetase and ligase [Frankiales bacterium]|nr:AMP-dependent synthetase and ligase [Frankiales bacterium]
MGLELLLEMASGAMPDRVVLGSESSGLTAADLARYARAGAGRLLEDGARSVAFLGVNGPALPIALLASAQAGIPLTPLNFRLAPEAIRDQIGVLPNPLVVADQRYHAAVGAGARLVETSEWLASLAGDVGTDMPPTDGRGRGHPLHQRHHLRAEAGGAPP